jgi:hypothetical protein
MRWGRRSKQRGVRAGGQAKGAAHDSTAAAQVKFVILDEADMMLSFGFEEDVETILQVPAHGPPCSAYRECAESPSGNIHGQGRS